MKMLNADFCSKCFYHVQLRKIIVLRTILESIYRTSANTARTTIEPASQEKHANFFVNDGTATAEDIRSLIAEAWHVVRDRFGVEMELEVELVGEWDI